MGVGQPETFTSGLVISWDRKNSGTLIHDLYCFHVCSMASITRFPEPAVIVAWYLTLTCLPGITSSMSTFLMVGPSESSSDAEHLVQVAAAAG